MKPVSQRLVVGVWLMLVSVAMAWLARHEHTAGPPISAPPEWPAESGLALDPERLTLVLFAHPRCPCTGATLGELELLMAQSRGRVSASVAFLQPDGMPDDWVKSDLWHAAALIPGVKVQVDRAGGEARRFRAETSGGAVLYDRHGHLLFQGGITISRGHAGDNPGRSALVALLNHEGADAPDTPVFGCPMFGEPCQPGGLECKK